MWMEERNDELLLAKDEAIDATLYARLDERIPRRFRPRREVGDGLGLVCDDLEELARLQGRHGQRRLHNRHRARHSLTVDALRYFELVDGHDLPPRDLIDGELAG